MRETNIKTPNIWLFTGPEQGQQKEAVNQLREELRKQQGSIDIYTKYASETPVSDIVSLLENDLDSKEIDDIENSIKEIDGVLSVIFLSREQGLEIMKENFEEDSYLLEGLEEDNPLQNSYIIQLTDIQYADSVVEELKLVNGIEDIKYYKDIIDKLMVFANYIRIGGIIVIGILVLVSVFIISNTIKLTVTSRKREINIMKYVGATNGYIRGPFIIEGILFGLLGAVLSILLINYGYEYFFNSDIGRASCRERV